MEEEYDLVEILELIRDYGKKGLLTTFERISLKRKSSRL